MRKLVFTINKTKTASLLLFLSCSSLNVLRHVNSEKGCVFYMKHGKTKMPDNFIKNNNTEKCKKCTRTEQQKHESSYIIVSFLHFNVFHYSTIFTRILFLLMIICLSTTLIKYLFHSKFNVCYTIDKSKCLNVKRVLYYKNQICNNTINLSSQQQIKMRFCENTRNQLQDYHSLP